MKKEFITPAIKVVNIAKRSGFLCTSSVGVSSSSYRGGKGDSETTEDTWTDL